MGHLDDMAAEVIKLQEEVDSLAVMPREPPVRLLAPATVSLERPVFENPRSVDPEDRPASALPDLGHPTPTVPETLRSAHDYGDGLQIGFWGWLSYLAAPQDRYSTFWAWEAELDITKSFTEDLAAAADIDFVDTNEGARVNLEQLFVSLLFPCGNDAILTAGKFNAPFGVERRDFWDRQTGSASLLFGAQPRDLTGMMLTQPWPATNLTFRAFVVNGFDNNLDINQQPSLGIMVERRHDDFSLALTTWGGPEFANNNDDKLYFAETQATWQVTPNLSLAGEFLYGITDSPTGRLDWTGYMAIVSYTLCDKWRLFGQWSDLNDGDGFITGDFAHEQQVSAGLAWYLHPRVEARFEYRHDINREPVGARSQTEEVDEISAHLTFGY